ncbi:MAG: hypothetical protein ACI9EQ_001579 [Bacteroidia bacterium]|jgi:hypothetical protein
MLRPTFFLKGIAWPSLFFILLTQLIITITGFLNLHCFVLDFTLFEQLDFFFENEKFGYTFNLALFGYDLGYLLNASRAELEQFFPNFATVIYVTGWLIRYVIPFALIVLCLMVLRKMVVAVINKQSNSLSLYSLPMTLITTLAGSLIAYYFVCPHNSQPVEFQILLARLFLVINVFVAAVFVIVYRLRVIEKIKTFLFAATLPYSLAITRILFFAYSVFIYLTVFRFGKGPSFGQLDKVALPGIGWLIEIIPVNAELYAWFCYIGAGASLMVMLGFRTRFFMILNSIVIFYVVASPNFFGKLWHEQIVIWISWIFMFSPCFDVLSMDALRQPKKKIVEDSKYGFHLKLIWLHFGHIYFFAGFYKLWIGGFDWALSDSIVHLVQIEWFENYDVASSWRVDRFPTLLKLGGLAVIFFEMFYMLLLFGKRTRWISVLGGLTMHNLIAKVMYISFFWLLQAFYIVFIPWNWLLLKVGLVKRNLSLNHKPPSFYSASILIPTLILVCNIICGIFRIDSYPFSVYPVYCDILPKTVKYFDYRIQDDCCTEIDFREEGAKAKFRWEDFSRQEYEMIRQWNQSNLLDTAGVKKMWKRWQLGVPTLQEVDFVEVYVVERHLSPEMSSEFVSEKYLMKIVQ